MNEKSTQHPEDVDSQVKTVKFDFIRIKKKGTKLFLLCVILTNDYFKQVLFITILLFPLIINILSYEYDINIIDMTL